MTLALRGVFILEQPALSFFEYFPRFVKICRMVKIWRGSWYMLHYGGPTPKRHFAYSNSKCVLQLNRGRLRGWKKKKDGNPVKHYVDRRGKRRFVGTKFLKGTGRETQANQVSKLNLYVGCMEQSRRPDPECRNRCLRTYPPQFGARIASLMEEIHSTKTEVNFDEPLEALFLQSISTRPLNLAIIHTVLHARCQRQTWQPSSSAWTFLMSGLRGACPKSAVT